MTPFGIYEALYLSLVDWGRRVHGPQDLPEYNALLGLASLATMNLFSAIMAAEVATGTRNLIPIPKVSALLIWLGLVLLHYVMLLPSARLARVREGKGARGAKMRWVLLYAIVSFVAYLTLLRVRTT